MDYGSVVSSMWHHSTVGTGSILSTYMYCTYMRGGGGGDFIIISFRSMHQIAGILITSKFLITSIKNILNFDIKTLYFYDKHCQRLLHPF